MNLLPPPLVFAAVSYWLVGSALGCSNACNSQYVNCQGICTQQYGSSPTVLDCKNQCNFDYQLCCPAPIGDGVSVGQDTGETELQKLIKICETTFEAADVNNKDFKMTKEEYFQHSTLYAEKVCPNVARTKDYHDTLTFLYSYNNAACGSCIGSLDPTDPTSGTGTWESCGCDNTATEKSLIKPLDTGIEVQVYCLLVHSLAYIQCHQPEDACLDTCNANDTTCWEACNGQYGSTDMAFFICLYQCEPSYLGCIKDSCSTTNAVITTDAADEEAGGSSGSSGSTALSAISVLFTSPLIALLLRQVS